MAAATAEILRDSGSLTDAADAIDFPAAPTVQRPSAPAPAPPPANPITIPGVGSFSDAASAINPTFNAEQEAKQREIEQAKIRANAMRPEYANIADATKTREGILATLPKPPVLTPPPSLALRDFLATSENESPIASIGKLIQAMSLFANVAVGGSRQNAVGALAAFTGAMKGWQEGDQLRSNRDFKEWETKTNVALKEYETQRMGYHDALTASGLSLDGRIQQAKLKALELGDTQAVLALESGNLDATLKLLTSRDDAQSKLAIQVQKIMDARAEAARKVAADAETARHHKATEDAATAKLAAEHAADAAHALDPKAVEMYAQQVAQGGQMPSMGMGKAATATKVAIANRAAQIADAMGGTEALAARQAVYKATSQELAKVQGQRGLVMSFARTFDKNLDVALELSGKVERGQAPVFNRWALAGRQAVQGDPEVAAFNAAVQTVIQEYARVASGSTQVSDHARDEAKALLSTAQNAEQFRRVAEILKRDTHNREAGYDDQIKSIEGALTRFSVKPGGAKTMKIRATGGGPVLEGPDGPVPAGYERVGG